MCAGKDWANAYSTDGNEKKVTMHTQRSHTRILRAKVRDIPLKLITVGMLFLLGMLAKRDRKSRSITHQQAMTASSTKGSAFKLAAVVCQRGGLHS